MAFRFKRRHGVPHAALGGDAAAVATSLDEATTAYSSDPADFDLSVAIGDLLDRAPTDDLRMLRLEGMDEEDFYDRELRPNWEDLSKGERAAKVEAFARLANALSEDMPGGMAAVVRTKLIVLAWAYDRTYGGRMLPQVARDPERFGRLELSQTS